MGAYVEFKTAETINIQIKDNQSQSVIDFSGVEILRDGVKVSNSGATGELTNPTLFEVNKMLYILSSSDSSNPSDLLRIHKFSHKIEGGGEYMIKELSSKITDTKQLNRAKAIIIASRNIDPKSIKDELPDPKVEDIIIIKE